MSFEREINLFIQYIVVERGLARPNLGLVMRRLLQQSAACPAILRSTKEGAAHRCLAGLPT